MEEILRQRVICNKADNFSVIAPKNRLPMTTWCSLNSETFIYVDHESQH